MKLTPPVIHFSTPERYWDDATEGDVCISPTYDVTEARINAYAVLTGDYTPCTSTRTMPRPRPLAPAWPTACSACRSPTA